MQNYYYKTELILYDLTIIYSCIIRIQIGIALKKEYFTGWWNKKGR